MAAFYHACRAADGIQAHSGWHQKVQPQSGKCVEKWSNLLIDFRLAGLRHQKPASKLAQRKSFPGAGSPPKREPRRLMCNEGKINEAYG